MLYLPSQVHKCMIRKEIEGGHEQRNEREAERAFASFLPEHKGTQ